MRVCPCCGYVDPAHWKHCKFSYHIDSCNWETFRVEYPELAKNLTQGGAITEDKDYYYRLGKTKQVVMRKAKIEWTDGNPFGAEKYERFKHGTKNWEAEDVRSHWNKAHPNQTKLLFCSETEHK